MSPAGRAAVTLALLLGAAATVVIPAIGGGSPSTIGVPAAAPTSTPTIDDQAPISAAQGAPDRPWGPTAPEWSRALADARSLSVEDAAGLVIVPRWNSPDASAAAALMERGGFGGMILMRGAIQDAGQVARLTSTISAAADHPWGTLVSVDQEGGTVARLAGLVPDLPGFMAAGAARDPAEVEPLYAQAAVDMRAMGFTVDYAPVADMTIGPSDPTIRTRSAGDDVDDVSATVIAAVDGYLEGGVVPVIKHFPGHGSVTVDSHAALPVQRASLEALGTRDLVPFQRAIDAGAPALMMGHISVPAWGPGPATLEPAAYAHAREAMGFDGLIFTDALDMGAITDSHAPGDAAVDALAAGADVLLMPPDPMAARAAIVAAVESGALERERLDEAAARLIALQRWQRGLGPFADTGENYGRALAVAGATVAARDCDAPLVEAPVLVTGGRAIERERLASALVARGIGASADAEVADGSTPSPSPSAATTVHLTSSRSVADGADVLVALGGPWVLEGRSAEAYVAVYGRSDDALAGLADVLAGAAPGGDWPVAVDVPHSVCS